MFKKKKLLHTVPPFFCECLFWLRNGTVYIQLLSMHQIHIVFPKEGVWWLDGCCCGDGVSTVNSLLFYLSYELSSVLKYPSYLYEMNLSSQETKTKERGSVYLIIKKWRTWQTEWSVMWRETIERRSRGRKGQGQIWIACQERRGLHHLMVV